MQSLSQAYRQLNTLILGKPQAIRLSFACLIARGHLLIEDVPGVGKTTLAHGLATVLGLDYRRVQFTSDLLPAGGHSGEQLGCRPGRRSWVRDRRGGPRARCGRSAWPGAQYQTTPVVWP